MALPYVQKKFVQIALGLVVVLLFIGAYLFGMNQPPAPTPAALPTASLTIGDTTIVAELATTVSEQEQGLSGRTGLLPEHGMFFVFDHPAQWGIWMKDMHFSIDVVWADENGRVITIEQNMAPESYPKSFYPTAPALYVLEVPAGFVAAHSIAIGSQIVVK